MKRSREPEEDLDSDPQYRQQQELGHAQQTAGSEALRPAKIADLDSAVTDDEDDDRQQDRPVAMKCSLPPHKEPIPFRTYGEYESHYNQFHTNRCLECRKNFPTEHLLGVHIEECHDPLVVVRRDKGEHTYSCFVEGCERKCLTHQKRRMHMIDKHMYPKNFFFAVTKQGIDGRRSLLVESEHHRRRSSTSAQSKETRRRASVLDASTSQSGDKPAEGKPPTSRQDKSEPQSDETRDTDMADLAGAMSSLQFVPPSIRFGRSRAGFPKR